MTSRQPPSEPRLHAALRHPLAKPVVWAACLSPLAWLIFGALHDRLGANPAEALIRSLGDWSLRLLLLTLAISPLRVLGGWPALARYRRLLGLFSFFYLCLHLLAYAWLDMGLQMADILRDIAKRPFILMGFCAWLLMLPLALSSFNRAMKALGGQAWQRLHRTVYLVALIALAHFIWMRAGKNDFAEPAVYGTGLALLLLWRLAGRPAGPFRRA